MNFYHKKKRTPQIIIVSLIDIFIVLVIFFITTTTFKTVQSQININLPKSKTAVQENNQNKPIMITITQDQKLYINEQPIADPDALVKAIKEAHAKEPDRPITMSAAKEIPWGFMVKVQDSLKEAGITKVGAYTKSNEQAE